MADYSEYIRGGEILLSPTVDSKNPYILKCFECEEYFISLELFISHCFQHFGLDSSQQENSFPDEDLYDTNDDSNNISCDLYQAVIDTNSIDDIENEEHIENEEKNSEASAANEVQYEDIEDLEDVDDISTISDQTHLMSEVEFIIEGNENDEFVSEFIKSTENVSCLIEAYKSIPHLWKLKNSTHTRAKESQALDMQDIADILETNADVSISADQVSSILVYLRRKFRERLKLEKKKTPNSDEMSLPDSIYNMLLFLRPYINYNPIAILDCHPMDLLEEEIICLFKIYKRFPFLWNTDLMEYYCNNKRDEALREMVKVIMREMGLLVDKGSLSVYLRNVDIYFSKIKRGELSLESGSSEHSSYYEELKFLNGHVGIFRCTECNKKFRCPIHLKEHKAKHDGLIPLSCGICMHEFKSAAAYIAHVRRHMGDLDEKCTVCGKKFLKAVELRLHMRIHTGERPFFCELCGASYRQQTAFIEHKRKHDKNFTVFCSVCSKGFYTRKKMKLHMASHYDVRNFVCVTCGKAFKTRKTLQQHRHTHEEGRNHECNICGKMFKNKINLSHHRRTHGTHIKELSVK